MAWAAHLIALVAAFGSIAGNQAGPPAPAPMRPALPGDPAAPTTTRFTLDNGLKVVVQPDRRVPIVTVIVIYNVGAKDEKPGQYGYAHLFEHLMLSGSAHWDENSTKALTDLGASEINATTTEDRTIFYETVPRGALERTLFLEADRMGYLAPALTPAKVARDVDVVLNEKRQRGGAPHGRDAIVIAQDLYPADHPYRHGVIGEEPDLRAITVKDAIDWFRTYYGPGNATLIVTGDVSPDEARGLVQKYFGALEPRAPVDRVLTRVSPPPGAYRRERFEPVSDARIYATHIAPPAGSAEIAHLDLIAQIMGNGTASRLHRRLVGELGLATSVMPAFDERLLSSEMGFVVIAASPDAVREAEAAFEAELARFVAEGPSPAELERARKARIDYVLRSRESTFGRAFLLMRGESLTDDPDYAATYLRQLREATADGVRRTAQAVYGRPGHRLIVRPMPATKAATGGYDPAKGPPPIGAMVPIAFPAVERTRLANGLEVVLVPRPGTSTASMLMRFDAGSASTPGVADAMAQRLLLDADAPAVARLGEMGAQWRFVPAADFTDIALSIGTPDLAAGVGALAGMVERPALTEGRFAQVRDTYRGTVQGEANDAPSPDRLTQNAVFGDAHPYGAARDPAADLPMIDAVDLSMVKAWVRGHIRPDRARLYVAGDTTMAALRPLLATAFAGWTGAGTAAVDPPIPAARPGPSPQLIVIDRPGAQQSFISASRAIPPTRPDDDLAIDGADGVFGYMTGARIRTTLREKRGWTYGIGSGAGDARGPRLWTVAGSVDRDHTGDSIAELIREMRAMAGDDPPRREELDRIANGSINRVAAKLESNADLVKSMADSEIYGRPHDWAFRAPMKLRALTVDQVGRAAADLLDPTRMHWVVTGDWARIEGQVKDLGLAPVTVVGSRGNRSAR